MVQRCCQHVIMDDEGSDGAVTKTIVYICGAVTVHHHPRRLVAESTWAELSSEE